MKIIFTHTVSRYKSDLSDSQSRTVSLHDIKSDVYKKSNDRTRKEDSLAVKILRKIPFLKFNSLVSVVGIHVSLY